MCLGTYSFPSSRESGNYIVILTYTGDSTLYAPPVLISLTNAVDFKYMFADGQQSFTNGGATSTVSMMNYGVKVTGRNASFTVTQGVLPANLTAADLFVIQVPDNLA